MKKRDLSVVVLLILSLVLVSDASALYCDPMNESDCLLNQKANFYSVSSCDTLLNCRAEYRDGAFSQCITILRTNLSDCSSFPTENCYNDVMYSEQSRDCGCGKGAEFRLQDGCGRTGEWSGTCLDISTCKTETRTYYGQERTVHIDCQEITFDPDTFPEDHCDIMPQTRRRCKDDDTVAVYSLQYMLDECSKNNCALSSIELDHEIECDPDQRCSDGFCEDVETEETQENDEQKRTLRSFIPKIFSANDDSDETTKNDTDQKPEDEITKTAEETDSNTNKTSPDLTTTTSEKTRETDPFFTRTSFFVFIAGACSVIGISGIIIGLRTVKKRV